MFLCAFVHNWPFFPKRLSHVSLAHLLSYYFLILLSNNSFLLPTMSLSLNTPLSLYSIPVLYATAFYPHNAKFRLINKIAGFNKWVSWVIISATSLRYPFSASVLNLGATTRQCCQRKGCRKPSSIELTGWRLHTMCVESWKNIRALLMWCPIERNGSFPCLGYRCG